MKTHSAKSDRNAIMRRLNYLHEHSSKDWFKWSELKLAREPRTASDYSQGMHSKWSAAMYDLVKLHLVARRRYGRFWLYRSLHPYERVWNL